LEATVLHVRGIGVCGYGHIHGKSVDMDMDGKFHIHGKPDDNCSVYKTN